MTWFMICEQTGCCVIMRAIVMYTMAIYSTAVRGVGISKLRQEIYGARQNNRSRSLFSYRFFQRSARHSFWRPKRHCGNLHFVAFS